MEAEEGAPKRANSQQKTSCNVYLLRSSFGNFCNGQNWASSRKNCARRRERDGVFRHGRTARYYGRGGYVSVTALRRYDRLSEKNSQGNPLSFLLPLPSLPSTFRPSLPPSTSARCLQSRSLMRGWAAARCGFSEFQGFLPAF